MSVDEFGLGDWWRRPDQAAVGALDHLPSDQWPMLAAKWLAAGFDSPLLRQLAQLQSGESRLGTEWIGVTALAELADSLNRSGAVNRFR